MTAGWSAGLRRGRPARSGGARLFALGAVVVAIAAGGTGIAGAAGAPRHKVAWHVSTAYPPGTVASVGSACPTSSACFALLDVSNDLAQDAFASTANGGTSWKVTVLPAGFAPVSGAFIDGDSQEAFDELACPSATTCLVLGEKLSNEHPELATTTDGGAEWKVTALPGAFAPQLTVDPSIACVTATTCLAATGASPTSGALLRSTNAGLSWTTETKTAFPLSWITCSSSTACGALGDGNFLVSADGGKSWTTHSMPTKSNDTDQLACGSSTSCLAAGISSPTIWATSDGGKSWHSSTIAASLGFNSVSCGTASVCEAAGSESKFPDVAAMWRTTNSGGSWASQSVPVPSNGFSKAYVPSIVLNNVACHGADDCLLSGYTQARFISFYLFGFVERTVNGGKSWKQQPIPTGVNTLNAVSCASAAVCEAVASQPTGMFFGTSRSGASWKLQLETIPEVGGSYDDVACASTKQCVAVGDIDTGPTSGIGAIAVTTDGGVKWTTKGIPSAFSLSGVSCPSTTVCFAVGFASTEDSPSLLKTTNGGGSWTEQSVPSAFGRLTDVACASTKSCEAVGDAGSGGPLIIGTANGSSWKKQAAPASLPAGSFLSAVACPTTKVCDAVGGTTGGATGGPAVLLATANSGGSWKAVKAPAGVGTLNDVACSSVKSCEAGGSTTSGRGVSLASSNGGLAWGAQPLPTGVASLSGLSCPSTAVCYASAASTEGAALLLKLS